MKTRGWEDKEDRSISGMAIAVSWATLILLFVVFG